MFPSCSKALDSAAKSLPEPCCRVKASLLSWYQWVACFTPCLQTRCLPFSSYEQSLSLNLAKCVIKCRPVLIFKGSYFYQIFQYLWNYWRQIGQIFLVFEEFIKHERQKEWPHYVVIGILNIDMHIGQFNYSGVYNCISCG